MVAQTSDINWYDNNADDLAERYGRMDPDELHAWFSDLIPTQRGLVIDIGAGTGRDSAWFARKGMETIAVEPSSSMRGAGQKLYADSGVKWIDDSLPALSRTLAIGVAADVVMLGTVWMHVSPQDRPRAFRKLVSLTKSGGLIVLTLRHGPSGDGRAFYPVSVWEIETLARGHGLIVERVKRAEDGQARDGVFWDYVALRLPDDGTDALPLLRHIILTDAKTSTYKLGLLRSLCRIAEGAAGLACELDDEHVAVPLGLVALYWLRLYLPLIDADLPQSPTNPGGGIGLGFFNAAVQRLASGQVPAINLRIGASFSMEDFKVVQSAILGVARNIEKNPARFTTYAKGGRIFPSAVHEGRIDLGGLKLDGPFLESFGWLKVPVAIWRAM